MASATITLLTGTGDDDRSVAFSVHQNTKVCFSGDVDGLSNHNFTHRDSSRRCLLCNQLVSNHCCAELSNLARILGQ